MQSRVENQEEELESERQCRTKAEKQRGTLARELDDLTERVDEASGATAAQIELNKKREAEIGKLRRDVEESNIQHDSMVDSLKKKNTDATTEMSDQVDQLNKIKQKIEKEKHAKRLQIDEVRAAMDVIANEKANLEKQNKLLNQQRLDLQRKAEDMNMTLIDYDSGKKKIIVENSELMQHLEELENNNSVPAKVNSTLNAH